jgi:hypothetical protein
MSLAALASDSDGISAPTREIPILTSTDSAADSTGHFQVTVDPLITQRAPNACGALADSADQNVDFGWHLPIFNLLTIGYDTDVNSFRQDQTIWDDEEATSLVTTSVANKASLQLQTGPTLKLSGFVQEQQSLTGGDPGYDDATKYGSEAAWTPVKDVTTLKVQASTQETYKFNGSILDENLYTASLDQKVPCIPVTLHTAGSLTDDSAPLFSGSNKDNTIIDASLLWKIVPSTACSLGVQRQDTAMPATMTLQNTSVYFTQLAVQTSRSWTVTMRAAHEQTDSTADGQFLSTASDVVLSLGLTWKLGDRFNAGAGVDYRVLPSQSPASAQSPAPATVSLSAGGNF